jgi:predicted transcriptional regulator
LTVRDVAQLLGVTPSRVSQIEKQGVGLRPAAGGTPVTTQSTTQHLLPSMGEAAARRFEALVLEPDEGEAAS